MRVKYPTGLENADAMDDQIGILDEAELHLVGSDGKRSLSQGKSNTVPRAAANYSVPEIAVTTLVALIVCYQAAFWMAACGRLGEVANGRFAAWLYSYPP